MPFRRPGNSSPSLCSPTRLLILLFAFWLAPLNTVMGVQSVALASDTQVATAGYFRLSWHTEHSPNLFRLLEADNPRFNHSKVIYEGPDLARVLSGKSNGSYYYRVAELQGHTPISVSNTVKVDVAHHSLTKAFLFFAIGAAVFLATLLLILRGNRQS
jgi:hypothetical protein